jgi:hypothetical protein
MAGMKLSSLKGIRRGRKSEGMPHLTRQIVDPGNPRRSLLRDEAGRGGPTPVDEMSDAERRAMFAHMRGEGPTRPGKRSQPRSKR